MHGRFLLFGAALLPNKRQSGHDTDTSSSGGWPVQVFIRVVPEVVGYGANDILGWTPRITVEVWNDAMITYPVTLPMVKTWDEAVAQAVELADAMSARRVGPRKEFIYSSNSNDKSPVEK